MKIDVVYVNTEPEVIEHWFEPSKDDGPVDDWNPDAIDDHERALEREDSYDG